MRKEPIEKWIDLSKLPKWEKRVCGNKGTVAWNKSVGYKCKFKYDDIEGEIEIVNYNKDSKKLTIKYLDYDLFEIFYGHFQQCKLGKMLKVLTNEFKVGISQNLKDGKRDITIIDRQYRKDKTGQNKKWYKYHCNKCGNEDWIVESDLLTKNRGCNACCSPPKKAVLGINTIWDKARWMCDLGVSEEDAKRYTHGSTQKITVKCPDCGRVKEVEPFRIYGNKSIFCTCGDKMSYPEKFISHLLGQMGINYIKEYNSEWSNGKRYDFYFELNNKKHIVETHGCQHYNGSFSNIGGRTLEEEQENDKLKKELALKNNIDCYIVLDCRESSLDWIKNSITNSELNKILDLEKVDWLQCEEFALSNRVKEICDYWHLHNEINNEELVIKDLEKVFNLSRYPISMYLKQGNELGWCNYNAEKEKEKTTKKLTKINQARCSKKVEVFKDGESLGVFDSCHELDRQSEEVFGVKFHFTSISEVARGVIKQSKGYVFKYV